MPEQPDHAHGLSFWLTLEGAASERLREVLARLAGRLGGPEFEPHVTLLPGLTLPEAEVLARGAELAGSLTSLPLRLTRVGGRDEYFRCLYVEVDGGAALVGAFGRACRLLGHFPREPFFPHLSLAYGRLSPAARADLCRELSPLVQGRCEARQLVLVRTEGPSAAWSLLAAWSLAPRQVPGPSQRAE